jgi:hypothetical protein
MPSTPPITKELIPMTLPFDPFLPQMLVCTVCETIFQQAHTEGVEVICPHPRCGASEADFWVVLENEVDELFREVIGTSFCVHRQNNLGAIARMTMGSINPLTRLL